MPPLLFTPSRHWPCALLFIFCCGCGPGLLEGPERIDSEKEDVIPEQLDLHNDNKIDTETLFQGDTAPSWTLCPTQTATDCKDGTWRPVNPRVLISAHWISASAWFTHMNANVLLGYDEQDNVAIPFAVMVDFTRVETQTHFNNRAVKSTLPNEMGPESQWVGAVVGGKRMVGSEFIEAAAVYQKGQYQLLGIPDDKNSPTLQPISNILGTSAELQRIIYLQNNEEDYYASLDRICLFGEGLFCFDGAHWAAEISPTECNFITSVNVTQKNDTPVLIAVDENGTVYNKSVLDLHSDTDSTIDSEALPGATASSDSETIADETTPMNWTSISVQNSSSPLAAAAVHIPSDNFSIGGDGFVIHSNIAGESQLCPIEPNVLRLNYYYGTSDILILATDGRLFAGTLGKFSDGYLCNTGQQYETAIDGVPIGRNYYVLSPSSLYAGMNEFFVMAE